MGSTWIWLILIFLIIVVVLIMNISVLMTKRTSPTPTAPSSKLGVINIILLAAIVIFIIIVAFTMCDSPCSGAVTYTTAPMARVIPVTTVAAAPIVVAQGPRNMDYSVFEHC